MQPRAAAGQDIAGKVGMSMVLANVLGALGLLIGIFTVVTGVGVRFIGFAILLAALAIFVQSSVYFRSLREDLAALHRLIDNEE
jgi:hypothetical protein